MVKYKALFFVKLAWPTNYVSNWYGFGKEKSKGDTLIVIINENIDCIVIWKSVITNV